MGQNKQKRNPATAIRAAQAVDAGTQTDFGSNSERQRLANCGPRQRSPGDMALGTGLKGTELGLKVAGAVAGGTAGGLLTLGGVAAGAVAAGMTGKYISDNAHCVTQGGEQNTLTYEQKHEHAKVTGGVPEADHSKAREYNRREGARRQSRWDACMDEKTGWGMEHADARELCRIETSAKD